MISKSFIKCLSPKHIRNIYTNEAIYVPCGMCEACLLRKSAMNTLKCKLEAKNSRYQEFVTLTYDDIYVPQAELVRVEHSVFDSFVDPVFGDHYQRFTGTTGQCIGDLNKFMLVSLDDGSVLGDVWIRDIDYFALRKKVGYGNVINILRYDDVTKFLKRLRDKIYRKYGEKIRYFVSGEYGPEHFRPHWHLILYYQSSELAKDIREIIRSCWVFGRIDSSKSRGQCASYTASYVNSTHGLPEIYRMPKTKPIARHSIRLGEAIFKDDIETVYKSLPDGFNKRCVYLDGISTDVYMWRSLTTKYFPRCKKYAVSDIEERVQAYRIKGICDKFLGYSEKPYKLAKMIVNQIKLASLCSYSLDLLDTPIHRYFLPRNGLNVKTIFGSAVDTCKLFNSIYRELYISDYFLNYISKTFDYSECKRKVEYIDTYYKSLEKERLNNYLKIIQDTQLDYGLLSSEYVLVGKEFVHRDDYNEATLKRFEISTKYKKLNDRFNVRKDNY